MIALVSGTLIALGILFFVGTAVGLLRLPDCYTRMHAAGKGDSLSTLMMLLAFAIYNLEHFTLGHFLVSLKILLIGLFIFFGSPTATHAIINAGFEAGLEPWEKDKNESNQ